MGSWNGKVYYPSESLAHPRRAQLHFLHPPTLFEGNGLSSVFAQPLNVLRPAFWSMLIDILRFNRICKRLACGDASAPEMQQTLKKFLHDHGFGAAFKNW